MHFGQYRWLFVFFTLSSVWTMATSSPARRSTICGPAKCKSKEVGSKKFHYKAGNVYFYQYVINGTNSVEGGLAEQSGLHLSSKVTIRFLSACDAILFISDVDVWQSHLPSGSEKHIFTKPTARIGFRKSLEEHPLRFSYADGKIEEICPYEEESIWALNIKRGLLSAFQNTMRRLDLEHKSEEDDVHGRCKVEYKLETATSSTLTVERIKDIGSCGDKFGILSSVQGTPYTFGTLHQSMPAVSSTSECEQIVDRNLVSGVRCSESHKLASLARGAAGAYTNMVQRLDLISVYEPIIPLNDTRGSEDGLILDNDEWNESGEAESGKESESEVGGGEDGSSSTFYIFHQLDPSVADVINQTPRNISKRDSLQFHHDYHLSQTTNDYNTAKIALTHFCQAVKGEVQQSSGEHFEALMGVLRGLSLQDMTNLAKDAAEICQGDRTPFDDALEAVGTGASVGVIRQRILKGDAPVETIGSWIDSLTYIPKPDLPVVEAAVEILKKRDAFPNILLSYSSLAHSFCKTHPQCGRHTPISILSRLYDMVFNRTDCATQERKDVDQVLMYLKGIGNFGMYTTGIEKALHTCINKNKITEVRVAAIEGFRRMPCNTDTTILKRLYQDQSEDAEVRIISFLGLMKCPTYPTIRLIRRQLHEEEVNQVGSFVWTYVKNLQETALPSKAELQGLVADEILTKKFSIDIRKFSRNVEVSSFYDEFNLGVGVESNLLFSQNSYLPRSLSLNLTVDLFGESINVFEATLRMESFEHYVESIFGPNGKLRSSELYNIVSSLREKRAVPSKRKLRTLSLEYDAMKRYYRDPIASFSLKTFGNEVMFKRKVGVDEQSAFVSSLDPFKYIQSLTKKDTNWQKSTMLLDSSYIIPTGVGFPLNLSAQASSIMRFQATSMKDSSWNLYSNPMEVKLKGKLHPSALLTVVGSMTLSAFEIHTGIKVRANVRSSTAVEASFHMKGSQLMQAEFGLPNTKLEFLDYRSDVMFMQGDEFRVVGHRPEPNPVCTAGLFHKYLGLKLCGSSHFSLKPQKDAERSVGTEQGEVDEDGQSLAPYFPLNGPAHLTLTLDKADPTLIKTKLNYLWNNDEKRTKLSASYETTSSSSQQSSTSTQIFGLTVDVDKISQEAKFAAILPSHSVEGSAQLSNDSSNGRLEISAKSSHLTAFTTSISFEKKDKGNGKTSIHPKMIVTHKNEKIFDGTGEINIVDKSTRVSSKVFKGTGNVELYGRNVKMNLNGSSNDTSLTLLWDGEYSKTSRSNTETFKCTTTISKKEIKDEQLSKLSGDTRQIDMTLSLEFSEYPEYDLGASWKYQKSEDGFVNEAELRQGKGPSWSDRNALRIKHAAVHLKSHEGSRMKWMFLVTEPARHTDWGFELTFNSHGKSMDSAINLRYAPGKNLQSSISLKRAPGILTFFQIGGNMTLPNHEPIRLFIHLEEKSHRLYQGSFHTDWFGVNNITIGVEYNDKSKRHRVDKALQLSIETKTMDLLKLGSHIISDDKDAKVTLNSEYQSRKNSLQLGYNHLAKRKHKVYGILTSGEAVYLISSEIELLHGFQCVIKTDLASKYPDIYARLTATNQNGMQLFGLQYDWDATRNKSKQFLLEFFMDLSRDTLQRTELVLAYPGRYFLVGGDYTQNKENGSQVVTGRLKWDEHKHLHVNARLVPRISEHGVYDVLLQLVTPFQVVKNGSVTIGLDFRRQNGCHIIIDGSWGDGEVVSGVIESKLDELESDGDGKEDVQVEDYTPTKSADVEDDYEDDTDNDDEKHYGPQNAVKTTPTTTNKANKYKSYKFTLNANLSSSVPNWNIFGIKVIHVQHGPLNVKTDIDIQLPNEKEISIANNWVLPDRLNDILSTRAELHIKTPFVGYQNLDFQAILGQQDDSDVLAIAGIYIETLQYSITITGTPRFEEDGALGFDITTSNAKYDKIFGSFSYAMGDSFRLACQLGWPQVVIGLEGILVWNGWEEFQVSTTFTSPWMPVRNINALAKIDSTQAEFKAELNEDAINAKCDWVIEDFENFDVRLDGSSPFEKYQKFGLVLKNSFEEETYHSQVNGWINDKQIGYKLKGHSSEVEEEEVVAQIINSEIEIDSIVYPTIRTTFTLAIREAKFNLDLSLLLREGPINVGVELDLLDMFRFNEKITITTPYPGLFELEIILTPAIMPNFDVYNVGVHSKWRSGSKWQEGALYIRYGPQGPLIDVLTEEAANKAAFEAPQDENYDEENTADDDEEMPKIKLNLPTSQLFHFYSPLPWAKIIKFEYDPVGPNSLSEDEEDVEGDDEEIETKGKFPIRNFIVVYNGVDADLSTSFQNERLKKTFIASIDLPRLQERISLKLDGQLNLAESEKVLTIEAESLHPKAQKIHGNAKWMLNLPHLMSAEVELRTPLENLEEQSVTLMYAHNEDDLAYSVNVELSSLTYDKFATNIAIAPRHFSMTLNTPFQGLQDIELKAQANPKEDSQDVYNTLIVFQTDDKEVEIDLDSTMVDDWPTTISGTIAASFAPNDFKQGDVKIDVTRKKDVANATAVVDWKNQQLRAKLYLRLPQQTFQELDLKVDTPFQNYEHWEIWILHPKSELEDRFDVELKAKTPYPHLAFVMAKGNIQMGSSFLEVKKATLNCNATGGTADIAVAWLLSDWNELDVVLDSKYTVYQEDSSSFDNLMKFKLRNKIPTMDVLTNVDSKIYWETKHPPNRFGTGLYIELQDESLATKVALKLPSTSYSAELKSKFDDEMKNVDAKLTYNCCPTGQNYLTMFKLTRGESSLEGEAQVEWGNGEFSHLESRLNCSFTEAVDSGELHLEVLNPKTANRQLAHLPLASIDGAFNKTSGRHTARIQAGQHLEPLVVDIDIRALDFRDIDSTVNVSSSFITSIPEAGLRVVSKVVGQTFDGLYGGHWGEERAALNYNWDYKETTDLMKINATIGVEMSFPTAQSAGVHGLFAREAMKTDSKFRVEYNGVQLLNSDYGFQSESSAGKEKEHTKLELENHFYPFGFTNLYQYEYSGGYDGLNLPTTTVRAVEVYNLVHPDLHKLGGELKIQTNFTGREIALTGTHPTRKLELITNYDFLDHQFRHNARFTWRADSWIGYELGVMNMTNKGSVEHRVGLRVDYPLRVMLLDSWYTLKGRSLEWTTELNLNASKSDRKVVCVVGWEETGSGVITVEKGFVTLKHPSLAQDIRAVGELKTVKKELGRGRHILDAMIPESIEGNVWLDYANDSKRRVTLLMKTIPGLLGENSNYWKYWNISADIGLQHSATNLDLRTHHSSRHSAQELSIITLIDFKNSQELPQESKISFELFKDLRKLHIMMYNPQEHFSLMGDIRGHYPIYTMNGKMNATGLVPLPKAQINVNMEKPYLKMYAVHGQDLTDGYYVDGGVVDSRNVKFDISQSYDNFRFSDLNFFLRMNHSRLITSRLKWRPEIFEEIKESSVKMVEDLRQGWSQQSDKLLLAVSTDASQVAQGIWEDAKSSVEPFVEEMREECDFKSDSEAFQEFFKAIYSRNEFYSQDIAGYAQLFVEEVTAQMTPIFSRLNETRVESSQILEKTILWIYDAIMKTYEHLVVSWNSSTSSSQYLAHIAEHLSILFYKGVEAGMKLSEEIFNSLSSYGLFIISHLDQLIDEYKPAIYGFVHRFEAFAYKIIVQVSDYLYEARDEVMRSAYYQKLAQLATDVDQLYRDLAKNDAATNIRKYYTMIKNFIAKKISESGGFQIDLGRVGRQLADLWEEFKSLGLVKDIKDWWIDVQAKIKWLADYTQLDETIQDIIVSIYTKGGDLFYQTVLQASSRYQRAKTKFIFDADKGIISLEQKLPMPWNAFNETPVFTELPEYQNILKIQEFLRSSDGSFWDVYYKVKPETNLLNWLPPFDGHSMLVGSEYFFTFDGLTYNFTGPCVYLLAGDLVDSNFSISLQYQPKASHKVVVSAGHNTLIIDFDVNGLKDPKKQLPTLNLPVQMQFLQGYRDGVNLVVENNKGMSVTCNMVYRICQIWVSGWYSRKTAGMFGALDEEPISDLILSNGKRSNNLTAIAKSWDVSDDNSNNCDTVASVSTSPTQTDAKIIAVCNKYFKNTLSSLQPCFSTVKVDPYREMCLQESTNTSSPAICTSAMAYVFMCRTNGVIVKMPSACIKCDMNGEEMMDRDVKVIDSNADSPVIESTDVVLIVELKDCNKNFKAKRNIDALMKTLEEALSNANFRQNRYSVVVFGGDGVYDKPHPIFFNNELFTNAEKVGQYLNVLPTGNGSRDTFGAVFHVLRQLDFRPGVSKTFILFPCSSCQPQHMTMDFSDIHHAMLEQDATLHILMNNDFSFDNKKLGKKFFGMDSNLGYTKDDGEKQGLKGETGIRRLVKLPRSVLGYCTPLALQSNGTIFSGKKLQNRRENIIKLFTTAFSRRVVQTAKPSPCQTCYCSSGDHGIGKVDCFLCGYAKDKLISEEISDNDNDETEEDAVSGSELTENENEDEINRDDGNFSDEEEEER